eukprot:1999151-Amphidinium_carterae.1
MSDDARPVTTDTSFQKHLKVCVLTTQAPSDGHAVALAMKSHPGTHDMHMLMQEALCLVPLATLKPCPRQRAEESKRLEKTGQIFRSWEQFAWPWYLCHHPICRAGGFSARLDGLVDAKSRGSCSAASCAQSTLAMRVCIRKAEPGGHHIRVQLSV